MTRFHEIMLAHPNRLTTAITVWVIANAITTLTIMLPALRQSDKEIRRKRIYQATAINYAVLGVVIVWFFHIT